MNLIVASRHLEQQKQCSFIQMEHKKKLFQKKSGRPLKEQLHGCFLTLSANKSRKLGSAHHIFSDKGEK